MKRREFLAAGAATGLAVWLGSSSVFAQETLTLAAEELRGMRIADPHAHPLWIFGSGSNDRSAPTVSMLKKAGVGLCAFSAVGDSVFFRSRGGSPFTETLTQLDRARRLVDKKDLVFSADDLSALKPAPETPRALLAIEGGDALEGKIGHLDTFFREGVRMMTLINDRDSELGFNQRSSTDGPLTPFGVQVVERMNELGMLIDVAHAKTETLKSIVDHSRKPVIDSHTAPYLPGEEGRGPRRLRRWQEMEWVAKNGGVVCTWPLGFSGKLSERLSLLQWAEEIVRMKSRLVIEHCGLGTDGGGGLNPLINGWESIVSLPALVAALREAGLSHDDVAAFVGGNFLRVLEKSLS